MSATKENSAQERTSKSNWLRHFMLTPLTDLDFVVGYQGPFPVGMQNCYPEELKKRTAAAMISYVAGLRSIDYAYKRYVEDYEYKDDPSLGSQMSVFLERTINDAEIGLHRLTFRDVVRLGDQIADTSLLRVSMSLHSAKILANRGLLFETLCLIRFSLEQLAWCYVCEKMDNEVAILNLEANSCIRPLCAVYPTAGRLYGKLSEFAHWNPKNHHWFIEQEGSQWAYVKASSRFRAVGLCYVMLAVDIYLSVIETIYFKATKKLLVLSKSSGGKFKRNRPTRRFVEKACQLFPEEKLLAEALRFFA
jgi:hypothetical protein